MANDEYPQQLERIIGNDIEPHIMQALLDEGFQSVRPTSKSGGNKTSGYPDILLTDRHDRPTDIECKTVSAETAGTTVRSLYFAGRVALSDPEDPPDRVTPPPLERPRGDSERPFPRSGSRLACPAENLSHLSL